MLCIPYMWNFCGQSINNENLVCENPQVNIFMVEKLALSVKL